MRHIAKSLVMVGALLAANSATAEEMFPYLGVDYTQTFMRARSDWNLIFPKSYPGASAYVGTRFHENFGVELGYDWSTRRTKDYLLPAGSSFFDGRVTSPNGLRGSTKIRRTGGYLDLLGTLPVAECVELLGSLGFGWVQSKIVTSFNAETAGATSTRSAISSVSGKGRGVFRLGFGGIFMVTESVGVRAKINWASTSTLRLKGNDAFNNLGYDAKGFKGSTALLAGIFVRF
ncbi:MAG TPA: outer membrane beta-barrel protein [Gammaproteobacteria bacterium]|nr:outer membrane beta-barrel protein [Gammaproteobacteria bacterium]